MKKYIQRLKERYPNNGMFVFNKGDRLAHHTLQVPNEPGIYLFVISVNNREEISYLGKAGTITHGGEFSKQKLNGRLTNKNYQSRVAGIAEGKSLPRQSFFDAIVNENHSIYIKVYWFVTFTADGKNDIPSYAEAWALQEYYTLNKKLPKWNNKF